MGPATRLLAEIDAASPAARRRLARTGHAATSRALVKHARTRLPAATDLGREAGQGLDAHLMDTRTLVMAMPGHQAAAPWAAACLRHNIRAVIDVSTTGVLARDQSCMKNHAPWVKGHTQAHFRCPLANGMFARERVVRRSELPAWERLVGVHLTVNGQRVPLTNAPPRPLSDWNGGDDPAPLELTWLRMPMETGQAVSPRALLELCGHAERLAGPDGMCAFQSADGGRRAALVAVAQEVYRTLGRGPRSDAQQLGAISAACARARERVSADLFHQPEDLASLLAMARLMSREFGLPGLSTPHRLGHRTVH